MSCQCETHSIRRVGVISTNRDIINKLPWGCDYEFGDREERAYERWGEGMSGDLIRWGFRWRRGGLDRWIRVLPLWNLLLWMKIVMIILNSEVRINLLPRILPFSQFQVTEEEGKKKRLPLLHDNDEHCYGLGLYCILNFVVAICTIFYQIHSLFFIFLAKMLILKNQHGRILEFKLKRTELSLQGRVSKLVNNL